jgi:hypothetical protein
VSSSTVGVEIEQFTEKMEETRTVNASNRETLF